MSIHMFVNHNHHHHHQVNYSASKGGNIASKCPVAPWPLYHHHHSHHHNYHYRYHHHQTHHCYLLVKHRWSRASLVLFCNFYFFGFMNCCFISFITVISASTGFCFTKISSYHLCLCTAFVFLY